MSRFHEKPHGLTVCFGNGWSYFTEEDGETKVHTFPCMVSISRYSTDIDKFGYIHGIQTPAQQFLAYEELPPEDEYAAGEIPDDPAHYKGMDPEIAATLQKIRYENRRKIAKPSQHAVRWLDANAPGWSCDPNSKLEEFGFYFEKKKHADAFCAWVDEILGTLKYWNEK